MLKQRVTLVSVRHVVTSPRMFSARHDYLSREINLPSENEICRIRSF